jgi:RNA polymerase sigma factor (sigma-70 family)
MVAAHIQLARRAARCASRRWRVDADEAESVAVRALWHAARKFDPDRGRPFMPYAGRVIRNALADLARSKTAIPCGNGNGESGDLPDVSPTDWRERPPDAQAELADEARRLGDALGRLPAQWRQVIQARFGLGEPGGTPATFAVLAGRLGVSIGGVQKIEVKAMRKLRELHRAHERPECWSRPSPSETCHIRSAGRDETRTGRGLSVSG